MSHRYDRVRLMIRMFNKNCARFVGSQADATYFRPSIDLLD